MKSTRTYFVLFLSSLSTVFFTGCLKQSNTIDNNQVIETPYYLYFADTSGAIFNTNDGITINRLSFGSDGMPLRALTTSGTNLFFVKNNSTSIKISTDNGLNFNTAYTYVPSNPMNAVNGLPIDYDQTMLVNVPRWGKFFCVSMQPSGSPINWMGLAFSYTFGWGGSWLIETFYDPYYTGIMPCSLTSLTFTTGNYIFGWDNPNHRSFYRIDTTPTIRWVETTPGVAWYTASTNPLPTGGLFSMGHYNGEIIAIDQKGTNGAWYSDDTGHNWHQFSGLPANVPLLCVYSPFEEICLIGTYGNGLYLLNPNTHSFQPDNNGLGSNLQIRGIVAKENIYKNNSIQRYIYLASNKGIYVSKDLGINWVLVTKGNYTVIH